MPAIEFQGRQLQVNEDGFLIQPDEWSEELAVYLASSAENIQSMSPEHWAVVRFIREYYMTNHMAPMVRAVCKTTGVPLRRIYELFPSGPAKGACKLAGLPKPDGCV